MVFLFQLTPLQLTRHVLTLYIEAVTLEEGDGVMALTARLLYEGEELAVTLDMK